MIQTLNVLLKLKLAGSGHISACRTRRETSFSWDARHVPLRLVIDTAEEFLLSGSMVCLSD